MMRAFQHCQAEKYPQSRLRKNENVSTYTLNTLCRILDCSIEEVAVYLPDNEEPAD